MNFMNWRIAGLILPLVLIGVILSYLRHKLVFSPEWYGGKWKDAPLRDWLIFIVGIILLIFMIFWIGFVF